MPTSYTSSLRAALPATGENTGTWGALVNNSITQILEDAITGYADVAMTDADYTLTVANGSADQSRNMFVNMTGTLTAARNVICPTAEKLYFFKNSTTGGFAVTLKTSGGTGISVPNGKSMVLMCDGTNVIDATSHMSSLTLTTALAAGSGGTGLTSPGTSGNVLTSNGTAWVSAAPSGSSTVTVTSRSSNTIFAAADSGGLFQYTSTFTQTFPAAATLGSGWNVLVQNIGTGVITFDADGSETFNTPNGARTTINMYPGEGFEIVCNGTGYDLIGRSSVVMLQAPQTASVSVVDFEQGFTDDEFSSIRIEFSGANSSGQGLGMRVKKSGAYVTSGTYNTSTSFANGSTALNLSGQTAFSVSGVVTSSGQESSGWVELLRPTDSFGNAAIIMECSTPEASVQAYRAMGAGYQTTAAALQGVRFLEFSGSVLIAGRFTAYGRRG